MVQAPPPPPPPFLPPEEEIRQRLDGQQVKIQAFLFGTFVIYTIILILGRLRSRGNSFMKLFSTKSFMITAFVITYIPGLMNAPDQSNDLYLFWIAFLAYLAAVTNEISCYTLGDNEDRKKRLIVDYSVAWPLIFGSLYKSLAAPEVLVPIVLILWVVVLKLRERSRALMFATNSTNGLSRGSKIISHFANFNNNETCNQDRNNNNNPSYNRFLVGVREAQNMVANQSKTVFSKLIDFEPSKVITLDRVLGETDPFLAGTKTGKELQNTCYSFSMFWLLLAKIAGYENVDKKIFKGGNNKLPDNAFEFVERELEFLYEYLFTNYYVIYERGFWKKVRDVCIISLFLWLTIPLLVEYRPQDHNILYVILWGSVLDTGFTRFVILAIIAVEFSQIGIFLTSKWAKVMYTCAYLQNQTPSYFLQRLIILACRVPRPRLSLFRFKPVLKRKIEQYSILSCYSEIPKLVWGEWLLGSYFEMPRMGQAGSWSVNLTSQLKNDIVRSIETCLGQHDGHLSNGVCSLEYNNVKNDVISKYVKNVKSQARIILVWQIATSLIEDAAREEPTPNLDDDHHFQASSIISKYCAYLVAFSPQVLPDHVYTAKCEFDDAVKELEFEMIGDEDDDKESTSSEDSILRQAKELMEKLKQQPPNNLWKTLAEFWIEMLLFLALAEHGDAIEAHANNLCVGGEFITHLWALVTHAGCSRNLSCLHHH